MKVITETRKLVAVVGIDGSGLFIKTGGGIMYIDGTGKGVFEPRSLKEVLRLVGERQPVYEGDKITIQF